MNNIVKRRELIRTSDKLASKVLKVAEGVNELFWELLQQKAVEREFSQLIFKINEFPN